MEEMVALWDAAGVPKTLKTQILKGCRMAGTGQDRVDSVEMTISGVLGDDCC
jgi:hypothetical protein